MAGGIAAGTLGSSGLLGAAAPLTVERPRSGGKPDGRLTMCTITGMTYPFGLCVLILALWLLAKILRAAGYHLFPPTTARYTSNSGFVRGGRSVVGPKSPRWQNSDWLFSYSQFGFI